jgi:hypothetical protein
VLRDAVLAVSGKLDLTMFGPPVALQFRPDGLMTISDREPEANRDRRSVYLMARRTYPLTFLRLFDFPIIDTNCTRRAPSATPLQSLAFMNDTFVVESAAQLADRIEKISGAGAPTSKKIATAYWLVLGRKPEAAEIALCEQHLKKQEELYIRANATLTEAAHQALASLSQTLLSSNEFLYVD